VTSRKASTERARENGPARDGVILRDRPWFVPPGRDPRGRGMCVFPGCVTTCERLQPACLPHWRNVPEVLAQAIRDGWQAKDQRRWLLACEALRLYWHAVAPS
jgi:hypothetical protein